MRQRTVAALLTGSLLVWSLSAGCAAPVAEDGAESPADSAYIAYMAALTVATEEGLSGAEAEERIAELGAGTVARQEIEDHIEQLRSDPVRWSMLEEQVAQRAEELRRRSRTADGAPTTTP